jgi:hypothetical protein
VLHHRALSPHTVLTLPRAPRIFVPPSLGLCKQVLGACSMGAVPQWKGRLASVSPLRGFESETVSIPASSAKPGPRRFARVPTHAVGVVEDRRRAPRAALSLPMRLLRVAELPEPFPVTLVTRNISSSGIYFLAPRLISPGTAIELEVALLDRAAGQGRVQMCTAAHIVRCDAVDMPGWYGYAASFDDFALRRDDIVPMRRCDQIRPAGRTA